MTITRRGKRSELMKPGLFRPGLLLFVCEIKMRMKSDVRGQI